MTWEIMPADNPSKDALLSLSQEELLDALETGAITGADRVRADADEPWQALEDHPAFEETVRQIEEGHRPPPADETRLDMNPLIDVSLVLLIFFILTTSYAELRKEVSPPPGKSEKSGANPAMTEKKLKEFTISVKAKMDGDRIRYSVESDTVAEADLKKTFEGWLKKTGKASVTIEIDPQVPLKAMVAIQDAAAGAGVLEMIRVNRKK